MKRLTREQAIADLRSKLLTLVDDEHSICEVAGRLGIFCGGFAQWSFQELKQRHPTIVRSRKAITPAELKDLANRWQLARQESTGDTLACDTQAHEPGLMSVCKGWGEFSDEDLAHYHQSICGEEIELE